MNHKIKKIVITNIMKNNYHTNSNKQNNKNNRHFDMHYIYIKRTDREKNFTESSKMYHYFIKRIFSIQWKMYLVKVQSRSKYCRFCPSRRQYYGSNRFDVKIFINIYNKKCF